MVISTDTPAAASADHRTVGRVMMILELVVASDTRGISLAELAVVMKAPKSSVHSLAKGLMATGYLRESEGRYLVGPAISSLIGAAPATLQSAYRHVLSELVAKWNETAMLATLVGDSVVYVDSVQPEVLIRANPTHNKRFPLWPRSSGRVFLAAMEPKRFEAYLRRHHPDAADAQHVRDEVAATKASGVGINVGGSVADHIGLAVPIVLGAAPVTTAIAIAGPKSRIQEHVDEIAADMQSAVASLSG
jgi:DNA-binding IclR family transcriptional regulator